MSATNKTQKLIKDIRDKIAWGIYLPDERLPSVRQLAKQAGVSAYTVSQAYDQLVADRDIYARQGAGYYVHASAPLGDRALRATATSDQSGPRHNKPATPTSALLEQHVLDTSWLMGHIFHEQPLSRSPGNGLFPDDWLLDAGVVGRCSRQVIRQVGQFIYGYGHLQGHVGLRQQFARQLATDNITALPEQMVTTSGGSHAMELILRSVCQVGDFILVDDPCWHWLIGCAQQMGIKVVGIPRTPEGCDLEAFEQALQHYNPKLYITNSRLHNPTGFSYSAQHLYKVLALLQQHNAKGVQGAQDMHDSAQHQPLNCYLVEDDVFGHLCEPENGLRFASLDGFDQVIYVNGVAKSLGGNWRVGVMVCTKPLLKAILRQKMLSNTACSELNERIIDEIWRSSDYGKHIRQMRGRLAQEHQQLMGWLIAFGLINEGSAIHPMSMFVWLDVGLDSAELALQAHKEDWHVAPGHLFSASGNFKTYIRLNVATTTKAFLLWLREYVDKRMDKG